MAPARLPFRVKAVLFDLDRTLIDRDSEILRYADELKARLPEASPEVRDRLQARFLALDDRGRGNKTALFQTLCREYGLAESPQALRQAFDQFPARIQAFPDAHHVIRQLKARGLRVGIVTNGTSQWQRAKLTSTGLIALADALEISEERGVKKPDPLIFRHALEALGCSAADATFVGDSEEADIAGPKALGMHAILLRYPGDAFASAADCEIGTLTELLDLLVLA